MEKKPTKESYRIEEYHNYWDDKVDYYIIAKNNKTICVCYSAGTAKRICKLLNNLAHSG
jgi:hypothetical protein